MTACGAPFRPVAAAGRSPANMQPMTAVSELPVMKTPPPELLLVGPLLVINTAPEALFIVKLLATSATCLEPSTSSPAALGVGGQGGRGVRQIGWCVHSCCCWEHKGRAVQARASRYSHTRRVQSLGPPTPPSPTMRAVLSSKRLPSTMAPSQADSVAAPPQPEPLTAALPVNTLPLSVMLLHDLAGRGRYGYCVRG